MLVCDAIDNKHIHPKETCNNKINRKDIQKWNK